MKLFKNPRLNHKRELYKALPADSIDFDLLLRFCEEKTFGPGYFTAAGLKQLLQRSRLSGQCLSWVALYENDIVGLRLSLSSDWPQLLPPGQRNLEPEGGYLKSCVVVPAHRGQGLATALTRLSLKQMQSLGLNQVTTHSWKESPEPSTGYLHKLGLQITREIPGFWSQLDYKCSRCAPQPCQCTALEMTMSLMGANWNDL